VNEGKSFTLKLSTVYPDTPQGGEVQKTGGKYDPGHSGILLWRVKFVGQSDPAVFTTIASPDAPKVGDSVELHISKEDVNGRVFQKGFTPEQYAKETAPQSGGRFPSGSDSKHAGWSTMYVIHIQARLKEGMSLSDAKKAATADTNEVFKLMEV